MRFQKGHKINLGKHRSEETKKKISEILKGRKLSEEHRKKLSEARKRNPSNALGKHWKLSPRSEEYRRKLSISKMGNRNPAKRPEVRKKMSESQKGKIRWFSKEHRKKIGLANSKPHLNQRGKKCHLWKGGITLLHKQIRNCFKYRQWRSDIFTRDNFTCRLCGKRGGWIEADHHPKRFSTILHESKVKTLEEAENYEEFWNINNGRTLCKRCHNPKKVRRGA